MSKTKAQQAESDLNTTINFLAKAAAVYAFRNGPVEDMHADGQLSDTDMKTLNINMVNRLGEIFCLMTTGRISDLYDMLRFSYQYTTDWNDVDLSELEANINLGKAWTDLNRTRLEKLT